VQLDAEGPVAIAGPSGAGKSTVLRLIAGLATPTAGVVECHGRRWFGGGVDLPVERRPVGFVFQDYALFPHMTVRANVAYGARHVDVDALLARLGIAQLAAAKPRLLSGGERQRVALARALAREPELLLLDEPLSALDPATRGAVAGELAATLRESGLPALVVTHSFEDAASLADRVVVIERGVVTQDAAPAELVAAPATPFVASFAGANALQGEAHGTRVLLDAGGEVRIADPTSGRVSVLVAPWDITLAREVADDSALNHLNGTIARVVPMGGRVRVVIDSGVTAEITAESANRLGIRPGQRIVASWKATASRAVTRDAAVD
jgi:molybdate transport system ATP-binding protein